MTGFSEAPAAEADASRRATYRSMSGAVATMRMIALLRSDPGRNEP